MSHAARVYLTYEEFAEDCVSEKYARKVWKAHIAKHGNVPMIVKCAICSGKEQKLDIKHGRYTPKRPSKRLRDEQRGQ
jgi:hypothetical protein